MLCNRKNNILRVSCGSSSPPCVRAGTGKLEAREAMERIYDFCELEEEEQHTGGGGVHPCRR
jgi:hypothetical protein